MNRRILYAVAGGLALWLGVIGSASSALAHGRGPHWGPHDVFGVVVGLDSGSLQVQPVRGGSVTAALTASTRVIREVTGSTADVIPGSVVDLRGARGQNVVVSIHVDVPGTPLPGPGPKGHFDLSPDAQKLFVHVHPVGRVRVVSVNDSSITVRYGDGTTATYPLSNSLTVLKDVPGGLGDLAIGQKVEVDFKHGSMTADRVMILMA